MHFHQILNVHTAYFNFFGWTRVLKHNKYFEFDQFFKVDTKQNNISSATLFIKFSSVNKNRAI